MWEMSSPTSHRYRYGEKKSLLFLTILIIITLINNVASQNDPVTTTTTEPTTINANAVTNTNDNSSTNKLEGLTCKGCEGKDDLVPHNCKSKNVNINCSNTTGGMCLRVELKSGQPLLGCYVNGKETKPQCSLNLEDPVLKQTTNKTKRIAKACTCNEDNCNYELCDCTKAEGDSSKGNFLLAVIGPAATFLIFQLYHYE